MLQFAPFTLPQSRPAAKHEREEIMQIPFRNSAIGDGLVRLTLAAACALAPSAIAQEEETPDKSPESQIGFHAGLGGAGIHLDYPVSEKIRIRGVGNYLKWDYDDEVSGTAYKGDLNFQSYGLAVDWHPTSGGFRMGVGAFLNLNEASASAEDSNLDINGMPYDAKINADLTFKKFAPYAGIGYGGDLVPGLNFYLDLGVLYTGEPELSVAGNLRSGGNCAFSVDANSSASASGGGCPAGLESDLAAEHRDARDDIAQVKFFPVAALGISYRF